MKKRISHSRLLFCDMGPNDGMYSTVLTATLYLTPEEVEQLNESDFDIVIKPATTEES